jgi:hypothetical protein
MSLLEDLWAPYSPDCIPCDFFREEVYQPLPINFASLKKKIRTEFKRIPELLDQVSLVNEEGGGGGGGAHGQGREQSKVKKTSDFRS